MNENQKITFIKDLGKKPPKSESKYLYRYGLFKCHCGKEFESVLGKGNKARVKSCGCLNFLANSTRTHGLSKHRIYGVWKDMYNRCYNPNSSEYARYGAIGVTVAEEWHDVRTFIEDMYPTFKEGLSIDKDKLCKEKGIYPHIYSKDTCCWATKTEQVRRTRRLSVNNTSGYRGVVFQKRINKYSARVKINDRNINLGCYSTPLEAAKVRDKYIIDNNLKHTLNDVL